jgi:ATP-dependent DNA helicase RecG
MDLVGFHALLEELRRFGADHQTVEAKRAGGGLPETVQDSMIAFANADGGTVLLGVDERDGAFEVTGLEDPSRVADELQAACAELEPPLRPRISLIDHEGGAIVAAEISPVSHIQRPCHRRIDGPHTGSYIRVGDADQRLEPGEVDELLAARSSHDHSFRPHVRNVELVEREVAQLVSRAGREGEDAEAVLRRLGARDGIELTVAGLLALAENPERETAAARVAYRRAPGPGDPEGTRFTGATHLEGRVGELLDAAMERLEADLTPVQIERGGALIDERDVPVQALREIFGNALMHRSLTDARSSASVVVEVSSRAVVITSPGGLHAAAELSQLGLATLPSVRNLALVRICEHLRTPSDRRIVENQASGISAADRACREADTMPALFVDLPVTFQAYLLRGSLDTPSAARLLADVRMSSDRAALRIVSAGLRLEQAREEAPGSPLRRTVLDARLAARLLAPSSVEDAATVLTRLEDAQVLVRRASRRESSWIVRTPGPAGAAPGGRGRGGRRGEGREQTDAVVMAIRGSTDGELRREAIAQIAGWTSTRTAVKWINAAIEAGLVEATRANPYDPHRAYRLTAQGRNYAHTLAG